MRTTRLLIVTALTVPLLAGCFSVVEVPVPASPTERTGLDVRGVVLDGAAQERVEFSEILDVEWTDDQISIIGRDNANPGASGQTTRQFPLTALSGLLVRQIDAGKTSGVIGGLLVGGVALIAVLVTGSDPRNR